MIVLAVATRWNGCIDQERQTLDPYRKWPGRQKPEVFVAPDAGALSIRSFGGSRPGFSRAIAHWGFQSKSCYAMRQCCYGVRDQSHCSCPAKYYHAQRPPLRGFVQTPSLSGTHVATLSPPVDFRCASPQPYRPTANSGRPPLRHPPIARPTSFFSTPPPASPTSPGPPSGR